MVEIQNKNKQMLKLFYLIVLGLFSSYLYEYIMKKVFLFLALTLAFLFLSSCDKENKKPAPNDPPAPVTGKMSIVFNHLVDDQDLVFNKNYVNPKGDTFTVTRFLYYISNIVLTHADNTKFTVPNSYYLIDHSKPATMKLNLSNIPPANYKSISFLIGVDSTRNVSGVQSGDLDPAKGMFWSWNSGYIFLKLEGKAPKSPGNASYTYHIGGFEGENKTQRNVYLDFNAQTANVTANGAPLVLLNVNVNELFKTPHLIDISTDYYYMSPGSGAAVIADNYADMITFTQIQN